MSWAWWLHGARLLANTIGPALWIVMALHALWRVMRARDSHDRTQWLLWLVLWTVFLRTSGH